MQRLVGAALLSMTMLAGTAAMAQEVSGEITVWDWQFNSEKWGAALKQLDAEFIAAHPGVTIKHVAQPHDTYYQLIQTANSSQTGPDVAMMHAGTFG